MLVLTIVTVLTAHVNASRQNAPQRRRSRNDRRGRQDIPGHQHYVPAARAPKRRKTNDQPVSNDLASWDEISAHVQARFRENDIQNFHNELHNYHEYIAGKDVRNDVMNGQPMPPLEPTEAPSILGKRPWSAAERRIAHWETRNFLVDDLQQLNFRQSPRSHPPQEEKNADEQLNQLCGSGWFAFKKLDDGTPEPPRPENEDPFKVISFEDFKNLAPGKSFKISFYEANEWKYTQLRQIPRTDGAIRKTRIVDWGRCKFLNANEPQGKDKHIWKHRLNFRDTNGNRFDLYPLKTGKDWNFCFKYLPASASDMLI